MIRTTVYFSIFQWKWGKQTAKYICRPGKSVRYIPEFAFSIVPQKCVETTGKFDRALRRVPYHERTIFQPTNILKVWNSIMLIGTSCEETNKS